MPTLRLGDAAVRVRVPVGDALVVTAPPGSSATVVHPHDFNPSATVTGAMQSFGPYSVTKTLTVTCTAGAVSFDVPDASKEVTEDPTTTKLYAGGSELTQLNSLVSGYGIGFAGAGRLICDWTTNGAFGAPSGSTGATVALEQSSLFGGKPMVKMTMGAAGTLQCAFTFATPVTVAQMKTMQFPFKFSRNTKDDGSAACFTAVTLWLNLSSGGRIQVPLGANGGVTGQRANGVFSLSFPAGAASQGWTFSGAPTNTSDLDADTATLASINVVIGVATGLEVGESIWLGPITANARAKGMVCVDMDGPYASADRWMLPSLEAQGLVARLNLNHLNVGVGGYMTYAQIDRAYAAGHSCGSHLYTASVGNGYSDFANEDAIYADIAAGYANLAARGYTRDNYTHVRGGTVNDNTNTVPHTKQLAIQAAHVRAGTKAIRYGSTVGGSYERLQSLAAAGNVDVYNVQGTIQVSNGTTLQNLTDIVDRARDRGELAIVLFHRSVVATPGSLETTNAIFDGFAQYLGAEVRKGAVDNMTFGAALRNRGFIA